MPRITMIKVHPDEAPAADIDGQRVTINIPDLTINITSLSDLLDWLRDNPDFWTMLIAAFLALLGGTAPPRKTR